MCPPPTRAAADLHAPRLELADILRTHGARYRQTHRLARVQRAALRAIEVCRTAVLGGHVATCDRCGAQRLQYHSCGNRHCPKCQTLAKERWLTARRAELLPIPYFHVVFTLPHALNALAQGNPRVMYTLLFRAAADTLLTFGRDPRHLGGTIGVTAILHTWGQALTQHLHLHCLVTGGALATDRARWIPGRSSFLFPVRALSTVFRAKYLAGLQRAFDTGRLTFASGTADLADPPAFTRLLAPLRAQDWVVYAKRPFDGPEQVLEYLGRYTHRIALSNNRLVSLTDGVVRFHWTDYANQDRRKILALGVDEFLRRFLLHVLPTGFMRIRHFGLLANRTRRATLTRCRHVLGQPPPEFTPCESVTVLMQRVTGIDLSRCPVCGEGRMHITAIVERPRARWIPLDADAPSVVRSPRMGVRSAAVCRPSSSAALGTPHTRPTSRRRSAPYASLVGACPSRSRPSVENRTASRPPSLTIPIAQRRSHAVQFNQVLSARMIPVALTARTGRADKTLFVSPTRPWLFRLQHRGVRSWPALAHCCS